MRLSHIMQENIREAIGRLRTVSQKLSDMREDEMFVSTVPLEVDFDISQVVREIEAAIELLEPRTKPMR